MEKIKVNGIAAKIHEDFGCIEFLEGERDLLNRKIGSIRICDVDYKSKIYNEFDKSFKEDSEVTIRFSINCFTFVCPMIITECLLRSNGAEYNLFCLEKDIKIIEGAKNARS